MSRFFIIDDFLPLDHAARMRSCLENHFRDYDNHTRDAQIWNYWYVPNTYMYLRTAPEKLIFQPDVQEFQTQVHRYAQANFQLNHVIWPWLSMYVAGCKQSLHNDATNGQYGYVYSLTTAKLNGGRTMLLKDIDHSGHAAAGIDFFDMIEPKFNRLLIFDDKIPHAVEMVEGTMSPHDARLVLHGHIL